MHSDIICTNPPYSYIRDFVDILIKYKKKFLFIGSRHFIGYKNYTNYLLNRVFWISPTICRNSSYFFDINSNIKKVWSYWYTNLGHYPNYPVLRTGIQFKKENYQVLDTTGYINCNKIIYIPDDYYNEIAVPISFIEKWNPNQFEIKGLSRPKINGKEIYLRFIIKRKSHACN